MVYCTSSTESCWKPWWEKLSTWPVVVAQLVELSFPVPEVHGSNPNTAKLGYRTFVYCQLYWKDKNKAKEAVNWPFLNKLLNWLFQLARGTLAVTKVLLTNDSYVKAANEFNGPIWSSTLLCSNEVKAHSVEPDRWNLLGVGRANLSIIFIHLRTT